MGRYSVRCILEAEKGVYEERITLWSWASFDDALQCAEEEAREHAAIVGLHGYAALAQAYFIGDDQPDSGDEVFSLIRDNALPQQEYLSTLFDTGAERSG